MRTVTFDETSSAVSDALLTTGEVARILGVSRQHVVDLVDRGDLPATTTGVHRRIRRSDVEAFRTASDRLTRDQRRSLWLGYAVAGEIVHDPARAFDRARTNLNRMLAEHPRGQAARWLKEWAKLLDGPLEDVLATLTSPTPRAREMRQNSPFTGVLDDEHRAHVRESFNAWARTRGQWDQLPGPEGPGLQLVVASG